MCHTHSTLANVPLSHCLHSGLRKETPSSGRLPWHQEGSTYKWQTLLPLTFTWAHRNSKEKEVPSYHETWNSRINILTISTDVRMSVIGRLQIQNLGWIFGGSMLEKTRKRKLNLQVVFMWLDCADHEEKFRRGSRKQERLELAKNEVWGIKINVYHQPWFL